jgi:hypothetical protein
MILDSRRLLIVDPICLEGEKSDTAMGASTHDDSVVENESDNIAIEQTIKDVEDNESIEWSSMKQMSVLMCSVNCLQNCLLLQ